MITAGSLGLLAVTAGCAASPPEVSTLATTGSPVDAAAPEAQREAAEAMYTCLTEAELPAEIFRLEEYSLIQWNAMEVETYILFSEPGFAIQGIPSMKYRKEIDDTKWQEFDKNLDPDVPKLVIDDVDHSEAYIACREQTGYVTPNPSWNPGAELEQKQALTDVTNQWIACARDHGFPSLPDIAGPVADEWQTNPRATLPLSTTEDQLVALIADCPVFDEERARCRTNPAATETCDPDPAIVFEDPSADPSELPDQAELERSDRLSSILWQALEDFAKSQTPEPPTP